MKNIKLLIWLGALFVVLGSCSLDEDLLSTHVRSDFDTEDDLTNAVLGCYTEFIKSGAFKCNGYWMLSLVADDLISSHDLLAPYGEKTFGGADTQSFWNSLYRCVNRANDVMSLVEEMDVSQDAKDVALGEAYFVRAFSYFYLVRLYGGVPLRLKDTHINSDFYLPRSSVPEVYTQIFKDLRAANELLPSALRTGSEIGRATKGTARGFLASAYLTFANWLDMHQVTDFKYDDAPFTKEDGYQQAINWCDSVINSGRYSMFDDYGVLWDINAESRVHTEVIHAIQFVVDQQNTAAGSTGSELAARHMPSTYGYNANVTGSGHIFIAHSFFCDYFDDPIYYRQSNRSPEDGSVPAPDTLDYRIETGVLRYWPHRTSQNSMYSCPFMRPTDVPSGQTGSNANNFVGKYRDPNGRDSRNLGNDLPILRYSEIYLIKAEAQAELGNLAGAVENLNVVRKRARRCGTTDDNHRHVPELLDPATVTTPEEFRQIVLKERGIEFLGEAKRWLDLTRMKSVDPVGASRGESMYDYVFTKLKNSNYPTVEPSYNAGSYSWNNYKYLNMGCLGLVINYPYSPNKYRLFPIPMSEMENNSNIKENNPGW